MNKNLEKMNHAAETTTVLNETPSIPGDPPVYYTQVWLNETYGNHPSWVTLEEDGVTGWGTIHGLVRALQIYLGIGADADFGNGTKSAFKQRFASTNGEIVPSLNAVDNIYGIISGALWCKGYYGSYQQQINCEFDLRSSNSIIELKNDACLSTTNNHVDSQLMKALLSMDQFVLLENYGGTNEIRTIQRYLNFNYRDIVGIVPCDGLFQRDMNKALIKVLQYVEGFRGSDVDGIFGNGTKNHLPQLSSINHPPEAVRLFNFCLTCNGYINEGTEWNSVIEAKTKVFQAKHLIPENGLGDTNTWMALLLSKGNPSRTAYGCDCSTILDSDKAAALYTAGYRFVGRYLSGTVGSGSNERSKALTKAEMSAIFNAGLRIFAIYQEGGVYLERYTYERGLQDAHNALNAATALDIPTREYIYFAVDYDIMDEQISLYVVPYFQAINEVLAANKNIYHIGIYGSRNVCSKICSEFGLASSSFVSDMSTGYSGNMGYRLPENCAFDQFHEYTFSNGSVSFPLDKVAVSEKYLGFNSFSATGQVETPSDAEMLAAAYSMLHPIIPQCIGSAANFSWNPGVFTTSIGPINITAYYTHSTLFSIDNDNALYNTYNISNGDFDTSSWSYTNDLFDYLGADYKNSISLSNFDAVYELTQNIGNGKISIGTKASVIGGISTYIVVENYLGTVPCVENSISVKFEFTLNPDNNDPPKKELEEYHAEISGKQVLCVAGAIVLIAVAIAVIASGGGAVAAAVNAVVTFITMLINWLTQTLSYA